MRTRRRHSMCRNMHRHMVSHRPRQHNLNQVRRPRKRRRRQRTSTLRRHLRLTQPNNNSRLTTLISSRRTRSNSTRLARRGRHSSSPTRPSKARLTRRHNRSRHNTNRRLINCKVRRLTRFNSLIMLTNRPPIRLINKHNSSRRRNHNPSRKSIILTPQTYNSMRTRRCRSRRSTQVHSRIQQYIPTIRRQLLNNHQTFHYVILRVIFRDIRSAPALLP